jgi:hypothetical protein
VILMAKARTRVSPPTADEIEIAKEELYEKLEVAETQPLYEKRSAEIVFAEKKEKLEGLLSAGV